MSEGRLLVVDDEEDYRVMMSAHLRRKGFDVETASDGAEALEVLEAGDIEVLITDLTMPEMDGLELLKRAKEADPYLEVVVISGAGTLESAISSMRMGGAYDYLPKPLDTMEDLSLAAGRALQHRELRVEQERLRAQVAAERERLKWVIENTRDALLSSDDGAAISLANPAAHELFGSQDLAGRDAAAQLPASVAAVLANWNRFNRKAPMVTEIAWPAGRVQMLSLTPSGGEGNGWVMLLRDVSELRRLQRLKMQLLLRTAGEVRDPLAGAFSALVKLNELPQDQAEEYTGAVQQGMNHLGAIRSWTDEVLNLVEIEAQSMADDGLVELAEVVSEVLQKPPELLEEKGIEVELSLPDGLTCSVQPQVAQRLLQHLLTQAAWRAPAGDHLRLSLETVGRQIWLSLEDGADPMLNGDDSELFESYLAAESAPEPGVGLSLAMVKACADALGAQVWLQRTGAQGNRFLIALPAEAPASLPS